VTSFGDGTVTVINGANNTVIGMPIPVSTRLGLGIGLNPGTNLIYLSVFGEPKAVVIDGAVQQDRRRPDSGWRESPGARGQPDHQPDLRCEH